MPEERKKIKINFPQTLHGGVYSNNMMIAHTREEFIMDFLMVAPSAGSVTSRIIVSPGHVKRILAALQENVRQYEMKHGEIKQAEAPKANVMYH